MNKVEISRVTPAAALPGGEVRIEYQDALPGGFHVPAVQFGEFEGQIVVSSSRAVVARVPESSSEFGTLELSVRVNGDASPPIPYPTGRRLATNLHPVANPAIDAQGNVFATYSGRRGQQTQVSIYKITPQGAVTPHTVGIMNATGLAFDFDGTLYVSSRQSGNIYAVNPSGESELFTEGMGVATGLAFDRSGNLYVGDRSGSVFKISPGKEIFVFATLEPSVAAYHLAHGLDDHLYVTGPTTSSFDSIYRISPTGEVGRFFTGLGRPQGIAFDIEGNLYVVASYQGRRGIWRFDPAGAEPLLVVSGLNLVGLAFDLAGNLIVADNASIYQVPLGTPGKPLP